MKMYGDTGSIWIIQILRQGILTLAFMLAACSSDPRTQALEKGVRLMANIVESRVLRDAVKNADPQMRATTAARGALTGGITSNFPLPPDGIAIIDDPKEIQPWCVILIGDDDAKQVRIEGYGPSTAKPAVVKKIAFPPA